MLFCVLIWDRSSLNIQLHIILSYNKIARGSCVFMRWLIYYNKTKQNFLIQTRRQRIILLFHDHAFLANLIRIVITERKILIAKYQQQCNISNKLLVLDRLQYKIRSILYKFIKGFLCLWFGILKFNFKRRPEPSE